MHKIDIDFGKSYVKHDNWFVKIWMHQLVKFSVVVVKNSAYFVGDRVFSEMLGPVMDKALDHYSLVLMLNSILPGSSRWAHIGLDYRHV